jgi:hypothetical protein
MWAAFFRYFILHHSNPGESAMLVTLRVHLQTYLFHRVSTGSVPSYPASTSLISNCKRRFVPRGTAARECAWNPSIYSVFQQNWRLRPSPITSTVAWKELKWEGGGGIKHRNMEHTVVPNVPLWNVGFQWILIVLLNVFSCKESSTCEHCVFIRELSYSNTRLQQRRLQHYTRNGCELATTQFGCWCFSHAASEQTELLLLYQQASFALIGHSQRAELDSAANSTVKHYSRLKPRVVIDLFLLLDTSSCRGAYPLKSNGNYMYHLLQQSVSVHFFLWMRLVHLLWFYL